MLSTVPAHAQFGLPGAGSSLVFDAASYARQLDQIVQQAQYWTQELAPLVNAGQLFTQPTGFSSVMDTLDKVQSLSYTTQAAQSQMQMWSRLGGVMSGCQGIMCVSQASSVLGQVQGATASMNYVGSTYSQVIAGTSSGAWASAPNPNQQTPSAGYTIP